MRTDPGRPVASRCISIAVMTGLVCVPVVIAAGLLTERTDRDRVPADITVSLLRRTLGAVSWNPAYGGSKPTEPHG